MSDVASKAVIYDPETREARAKSWLLLHLQLFHPPELLMQLAECKKGPKTHSDNFSTI